MRNLLPRLVVRCEGDMRYKRKSSFVIRSFLALFSFSYMTWVYGEASGGC